MGAEKLTLDSGIEIKFLDVSDDNMEHVEIYKDGVFIAGYCSCNGVRRSCPAGTSPHCDCTKRPPVLRCVRTG